MTTGLTKYDRRMYAVMNRRDGRPLYATAARRRAIVCAHIALTAIGAAAPVTTALTESMWPLFVLFGALLPWCLATGVINGATRGLLELRGRALDERQLRERDRVLARAHRVTTLLLLAAVLGAFAAGGFADVRMGVLLTPVLFGVLVVHALMPLWVAGLTVRDEPDEE
ncbi:hypothetical protein OIE62_25815 [Streptomyces scopuliridis]|uniref:Uncharacterized protein n=1 Tax=Streptomyces scopuliridis TaxID=452529 RepID=A0ACD4ZIA2_9ACTN|nr:hypothetical protein [Streptomyces scopuliridis]WSB33941.1 hypothetical protein OG949_14400 [Streptomyces scopuliridis]WSB98222.1 hypothetical protein OG835_15125 [Streptomyces scopuliridis]WSC08076.1 hypothetical protein OIE62_25815 [Streptomyces scopuliridis]